MSSVQNKFKRYIFIFFVVYSISLFSFNGTSEAKTITFYVSPSKIYDIAIDKGSSKTFTFNVGNKQNLIEGESSSEYNLECSIDFELFNEYDETVENKNIISTSASSVLIENDKSYPVEVTISIPDDFIGGSYVAYVNFNKKPLVEIEGTSIQSALRVPIYFFVGDENEYKNIDISYSVSPRYISFDNNPPTTLKDEVFSNVLNMLNPLKLIRTICDILSRPYFNVVTSQNNQVLDINNDIYVPLKNVITYSSKITNRRYVKYDNSYNKQTLANAINTSDSVNINLSNGKVVTIPASYNNIKFINDQLNVLAINNPKITMGELTETLLVPINKKYQLSPPVLIMNIDNKSQIPVVLKGNLDVLKNNSKVVFNSDVVSPTAMPNNCVDLATSISDVVMEKGVYTVKSKLCIRDVEKDVNYNFKVGNIRQVILFWSVVISLVYYLCIFTAIFFFCKAVRKIIINIKNKSNKK